MLKIVSKVQPKVLYISSEEVAACRNFVLSSDNTFHRLFPDTARGIVYSAIAGVGDWTELNTDRARLDHILIAAELKPPVWGVTRDCIQGSHIYFNTFCLGCHEVLNNNATLTPIVTACFKCHDSTHRYDLETRPFVYTIKHWPINRVLELLAYLIRNTKRNPHV